MREIPSAEYYHVIILAQKWLPFVVRFNWLGKKSIRNVKEWREAMQLEVSVD